MRKLYGIFVEHCKKWTLVSGLKGSNYYKNVERAHNFRIKSETGKWSISLIKVVPYTTGR
jgi:hypothetical protein